MVDKQTTRNFLTSDQVFSLNEKHGWFQYGDAQSDVSRAFAQDAIAMHERIRAAAPDLLEALNGVIPYMEAAEAAGLVGDEGCHWPVEVVRAAIAKATGQKGGA